MTKLVAAVVGGIRVHAVNERVAAEHARPRRIRERGRIEVEKRGDLRRNGHERRRVNRGWHDPGVELAHLSAPRRRLGFPGQVANETVVELKWKAQTRILLPGTVHW